MERTLLYLEQTFYEEIEAYKKSWSKENYFENTIKPRIFQFNKLCANKKNWFVDDKYKAKDIADIDTDRLIVSSYKAPIYSHRWGNCAIGYLVSGFGKFIIPVAGEIILLGALASDAYYIYWEKPVFVPSQGAAVSYHPEYFPEKTAYLTYLSRCAKMYLGCVRNNRNFSNLARVKCYSEF